MKKYGSLHVPDGDSYFADYFSSGKDVFEERNLLTALQYVRNFGVAVDGGAHVGSWTRAMAGYFNAVHAFEPQPDNFECLRANTLLHENVYRYPYALGESHGKAGLGSGSNSGCWYLTEGETIDVRPLPKLDALDFFKLDVEGFEYFALRGAERQILEHKPVVLIEEKEFRTHLYVCPKASDYLAELGYKQVDRCGNDTVWV